MSYTRWQRVEHVYEAVISRPEAEWARAITELCENDDVLRAEVESLLAHEQAAAPFLETPALANAAIVDAERLVGRRFGPYSVVGLLGVGGMGEVYRAHDDQLGRDVAIKILPTLFSNDPRRLARFEQEARTLASLNHPHIGGIYGRLDVDGGPALVLEVVEGETLAERLARHLESGEQTAASTGTGLAVKEALTIARQIAAALEAAHARGIIHRDLKPANIKITPDGVVKVLDFGLAKLGTSEDGGSTAHASIATRHATRDGMILGTLAYMSPEQAAGAAADTRSDLWAFGVVLLEMLTGRAVFTGATEPDVLAAVLKAEPDWTVLPADTPSSIRALLRRCLIKERVGRLESASAARLELDAALAPRGRAAPSSRQVVAAVAAMLAAIALAAGLLGWTLRPGPETAVVRRFAINTSAAQPINTSSSDRDLALSPDGRYVVFRFAGTTTAGSPLMLRAVGELTSTPLPGIGAAYAPFFSPDSQSIGFFENGELKRVSIDGGAVRSLCPVIGVSLGASWGDNNTIVFATDDPSSGLWRVSADGGKATVLTTPEVTHPANDHAFPSVLPGGRSVLFTITASGETAEPQVAVLNLSADRWSPLGLGGSQAEYVEPSTGAGGPGSLIYAVAGTLRAVRFAPDRLELSGETVARDEGIMMKRSGAANYALSRFGSLVYVPQSVVGSAPARSIVWVYRDGHEEKTSVPSGYGPPRLSPDNTRLAMTVSYPDPEIAVWDFRRETLTRVTFASGMDGMPLWMPDGRRIIFMSDRERAGVLNLYSQAADGSGHPERLTWSSNKQWPASIHGTHLFGWEAMSGVMVVDLATPAIPCALNRGAPSVATAGIAASPRERQVLFRGSFPEISPDCRYLAYQSNETGNVTIDVRPFPDVNSGHWQVSPKGGTRPSWAHNGHELFYLDEVDAFTVARVDTSGPTFVVKGDPVRLFDTRYLAPRSNPSRHYDVSNDDQRFLVSRAAAADQNVTPASLVVVERWIEEVRERVR